MDIVNVLLIVCSYVNAYLALKIKSIAFMNYFLKIKLQSCNLSIDQNNLILLI